MIDRLREANLGTIKRREQDAISLKFMPKIKTFFKKQEQQFMQRFRYYKDSFPESKSRTAFFSKLLEQDRQFTLSDFDRAWNEVEIETTDQLQVLIYKIEAEALEKGAVTIAQMFRPETGGSFDLANPRAVAWFSQFGGSLDYIKDIQGTSKDQLKTIITKAIDEGWSYNKTAKALSDRFTQFGRARAQLIATHESAQAYEAGNRIFIDGLTDAGIVIEKKWMNSFDEKVTPECKANTADGWIPLNQAHTSGDQNPPRFPGCRCYENYREAKDR